MWDVIGDIFTKNISRLSGIYIYIYIYIYNHIYIYIYLDIRHVATWGCGQMGIGVTSRPKKGGALHPRGLDVISYGFWRIFWNKSMGDHPKLTLNLNLITFFCFFVWLYIYIYKFTFNPLFRESTGNVVKYVCVPLNTATWIVHQEEHTTGYVGCSWDGMVLGWCTLHEVW